MEKSRIVFIQHGDYREAVVRFEKGGEETYYAQKFSVDFVCDLAKQHDYVGVISVASDPYDELLNNGVHGMGIRLWEQASVKELIHLVAAQKPDILILQSPITPLLRWAIRNKIRTLPLLADSFDVKGIRARFRNWQLSRLLNHPHISWVANHNVPSSLSLGRIGVDPDKILPWDWETMVTPDNYSPKLSPSPSSDKPFRLFFVGSLIKSKGIGDAIKALEVLTKQGRNVTLSVAGTGRDADFFRRKAKSLNLEKKVEFLGRIPHTKVVELMRNHDAILVPSHHEYPEGLPMVIYESFCSRTPLVISDHPMFIEKVPDNKYGLVFRAGDTQHFASRIDELMKNQQLYSKLSQMSAEAWLSVICPLKWGDLIHRFLRGSSEDTSWLRSHSLAAISQKDS